MPEEAIYEDDEILVSHSQAWVMSVVGAAMWVPAVFFVAIGFTGLGLVVWPVAGALGGGALLVGVIQLQRANKLRALSNKDRSASFAQSVHIIGGAMNAAVGGILVLIGTFGLALFTCCGCMGTIAFIAQQ